MIMTTLEEMVHPLEHIQGPSRTIYANEYLNLPRKTNS